EDRHGESDRRRCDGFRRIEPHRIPGPRDAERQRPMSPTDEFVLEPAHWPDMPSAHRAFLEAAIPKLRADERLVGLAAGGSFISRTLDEHSDLDLVVVSRPEVSRGVLRDGPDLARRLGPLLASCSRRSTPSSSSVLASWARSS